MSSDLKRRAKVVEFVNEWKGARDEQSDSQIFHTDLLRTLMKCGARDIKREIAVHCDNGTGGRYDLLIEGKLLVEAKSVGKDLDAAYKRALEYNTDPAVNVPYIMVDDFENFRLYDIENENEYRFSLDELPDKIHLFEFLIGADDVDDPEPIDIKVAYSMGRIFDYLRKTGYDKDESGIFMVRLAFCMFADDTGIFKHNAFQKYLVNQPQDGGMLGPSLAMVFQMLNTHPDKRQTGTQAEYDSFTYINGDLFKDAYPMPYLGRKMLKLIIDAGKHDWSKVSPAIFGTLFQDVMDSTERRREGAHYTTEENIMKLIRPLFLDDLRGEFEQIRADGSPRRIGLLQKMQKKLAAMKFFDPACGSGNFLIIAYRELRMLELDMLLEMSGKSLQQRLESSVLSMIDVDQFYGIEINGFAVHIAQTAMWMMDHLMNLKLSDKFGPANIRIPLKKSPNIICTDALDADWHAVLPSSECSYVLGNPPFGGSSTITGLQRLQIKKLYGAKGGILDYVCGWYLKAAKYMSSNTRIGFVSTNSITQGQHVGVLWPKLLRSMEIIFAYDSFKWGSEARGKAAVYVVMIGLGKNGNGMTKRLFHNKDGIITESNPKHITPYLTGSTSQHIISTSKTQICGFPEMLSGSKPVDDGLYVFTEPQRDEFLRIEPGAEPYIRQYVGAAELIKGKKRWILALHHVEPDVLNRLPKVKKRMESVRESRAKVRSRLRANWQQRRAVTKLTGCRKENSLSCPTSVLKTENTCPLDT